MPIKPARLRVEVAAPCSEDWTKMTGDDRVRFCDHCRQNVYNLSAMTEADARQVLEGPRVCVRFFARGDGTVITRQCPPMLEGARRRLVAFTAGMVPLAAGFWGAVAWLNGVFRSPPVVVGNMGAPARRTTPAPPAPLMGTPPPSRHPAPRPQPEEVMGVPPLPDPPKHRRRHLVGKPKLKDDDGPAPSLMGAALVKQ
jgi:hypothetical protein